MLKIRSFPRQRLHLNKRIFLLAVWYCSSGRVCIKVCCELCISFMNSVNQRRVAWLQSPFLLSLMVTFSEVKCSLTVHEYS